MLVLLLPLHRLCVSQSKSLRAPFRSCVLRCLVTLDVRVLCSVKEAAHKELLQDYLLYTADLLVVDEGHRLKNNKSSIGTVRGAALSTSFAFWSLFFSQDGSCRSLDSLLCLFVLQFLLLPSVHERLPSLPSLADSLRGDHSATHRSHRNADAEQPHGGALSFARSDCPECVDVHPRFCYSDVVAIARLSPETWIAYICLYCPCASNSFCLRLCALPNVVLLHGRFRTAQLPWLRKRVRAL